MMATIKTVTRINLNDLMIDCPRSSSSSQLIYDSSSQHPLERRRILGALRERTIFIQNNIPPPILPKTIVTPKIQPEITFDDKAEIKELVSRINDHVNHILAAQECSLEDKLYDIDAQTQRNQILQEELENRLIKIQRQLASMKRESQSKTHQYVTQRPEFTSTYSATPKPMRTYQNDDSPFVFKRI